jgi:hypothetical protein
MKLEHIYKTLPFCKLGLVAPVPDERRYIVGWIRKLILFISRNAKLIQNFSSQNFTKSCEIL